jgi:pyrrolysine biosynthesis protein PylD
MTRLRARDVAAVARDLDAYDRDLKFRTGLTLRGIACRAAGIDEPEFVRRSASSRAAVVSFTCGEGVIAGFAESLQRILSHLGLPTTVMAEPDVAGLAAAYADGSELVLLADDLRFIAVNTNRRAVVDNAEATGAGFAWGLNRMAGGLEGRPVLVLGCGPVGRSAALTLGRMGASVSLCDVDPAVSGQSARRLLEWGVAASVASDITPALNRHRLIVDATPVPNLIGEEHIHADTFISAPGVPVGLTAAAVDKIAGRLLHDRLEIGVAVMAAGAVAGH